MADGSGRNMRNRKSQNFDYATSKELILAERRGQGDCTYCPANHNENARGSKSLWGRKVAAKQKYRTGKGRKEIDWRLIPFWDLYDKHYEIEEYKRGKKVRMYKEVKRGELNYACEKIGSSLVNRSGYWGNILWQTLKDNGNPQKSLVWENDDCWFEFRVTKKKNERN